MNSSLIYELTAENAAQIITQTQGIIIVDFYAEWCAPCKTLKPIYEDVAQELKNKYVFARINIDKCQQIASQLQITSIPTIVIFSGGQVLDRISGVLPKEALIKEIEQIVQGSGDFSKLPKEKLNNKLIQAIQTRLPLETVTQILDAGADANFIIESGMTPLLLAIIVNANSGIDGSELIKLLLSKGASTEFIDPNGNKIQAKDFASLMAQNHRKIAETYDHLVNVFQEYKK
jgi:thioredoxin 1